MLIILSILLISTHHLFYFLIPLFIATFIVIVFKSGKLIIMTSYKDYIPSLTIKNRVLSRYFELFLTLAGFLLMLSIPFFGKKFLEVSRYDPVYIGYARNIGLSSIFAVGGLFYLIFKNNKNNREWFILLSAILLTAFIYKVTYMKWFLPLLAIIFMCIGLVNIINNSPQKKFALSIISVFLLVSISVSGYYQFLHKYKYGERTMEDSTFNTGRWIKYAINGSCISNDEMLGRKLFSVAETTHFLDTSTVVNQIYGFINLNISDYKMYPITTDDFWINGYEGPDIGSNTWSAVNRLWVSPSNYKITCVVENSKSNGDMIWMHSPEPSGLIQFAYGFNGVYDDGEERVWGLK